MYTAVMLIAATTNMEATSCHRLFRNRDCCQATCCPAPCPPPPACCGAAPAAPAPKAPAPEMKAPTTTTTVVAPPPPVTVPMPVPLTKEEDKMLGELLQKFGAKDKEGKAKLDPEQLKKFEQKFRSLTPAKRLEEYNMEMKPAPMPPTTPKSSQLHAPARIVVQLPADARLTVDGHQTRSTSAERVFISPPISSEEQHFYEFQATVERNGMPIQITRLIQVRAGHTTYFSIDEPNLAAVETGSN